MKMKHVMWVLTSALVLFGESKVFSQVTRDTTIGICNNKTTILVFPAAIADGDRGSSDIITRTSRRSVNILKVKAAQENFRPTNLSIITSDGKVYSINVFYEKNPKLLAYSIGAVTQEPALPVQFGQNRINDDSISKIALKVYSLNGFVKRPAYHHYGIKSNLSSVYIRGGVLFFRFVIRNRSEIPYQIDFSRYEQKDKSASKKTSSMEQEMMPIYSACDCGNLVGPGSECNLVVAFDQFTIADKKYFSVGFYEKNGDRNIHFDIKGKQILKARPL
jgi:conjugative transposon TraN protein